MNKLGITEHMPLWSKATEEACSSARTSGETLMCRFDEPINHSDNDAICRGDCFRNRFKGVAVTHDRYFDKVIQ